MSNIMHSYYKYCIVPLCRNTTLNTSDKIFFTVPKNPILRNIWNKAMKRHCELNLILSSTSSLWCCEDHFSLEDDMENYEEWKLTKNVKRFKLNPGIVPHRFECQMQNSHTPIERTTNKKRNHLSMTEETLSSQITSTSTCQLQEECLKINSSEDSLEVAKTDKPIQVAVKKSFQSKGTGLEMTSAVCSIKGSFDWRIYLKKPKFIAAPVSCFKHVALSDCWDSIVGEVYVEVRSPDCKTCCTTNPCRYWIASVVKVAGYMGLLQFQGYDNHSGLKWINLCTEPHIHPVGWCAENKKPLVPPKCIEEKRNDWKEFFLDKIIGFRTIPPNFKFRNVELSNNIIKEGMKLEVVDKNLISVVRSAKVTKVVGGRLHVVYLDTESEDEGFWCHERSPLIHPVGWAQIIGHALKGLPEYARESLQKTLYRTFEPNDATWDMFLPVINPVRELRFKPGMKLEAIDPLNLSTICVATVTEVLRNNYLMIGIDGMMAANGSDCFCYHASSPCIFPVGFCEEQEIKLTPPRGYKGEFKWSEYLKKTKSTAAPVDLFHRDIPDHGFKENMYLEAVDLMEPRLICVASITKVVGRLLRVHFEGWEDDYDQWCDCQSPDLFPVGWCDVLGYKLEPPRIYYYPEEKKKKKPGRRKRKRGRTKKVSDDDDDDDYYDEDEEDEDEESVVSIDSTEQKKPEVQKHTRKKSANVSK